MAEECSYYYWDAGYSCSLKYATEGSSSIDSDTVHRYCWGYHYQDCPRYRAKSSGGSSSGCFLTSACVEAKGLADDCRELTVLRAFRDNYMKSTEAGNADICRYYHIAPTIVENIKKRPNALEIFEKIYDDLVIPCVDLIDNSKNEEAYQKYKCYVETLAKQYLTT